ncbi:methionine sulfoxide oxidase MICAL3 protein [Phytophthora cinnamomi]|uniref:methionine sulfoxide oxidase MICAL3 protein n=1 Tax=Phytophthora cinnamomi TaxID=4785 RepID=UPI0035595C58|nr:methionine sulfoxide oxidase MICAL3 protein [Phytophthora cinnamomi]
MHKSERSPPVHDFERPRAMDRQIAYIGEGLIDPNGLDSLDQIGDIDIDDKSPQNRRPVLDDLAIGVGEKYLDDIYRENGNGGVNPEHHASPYPPTVRPVDRIRTDKELAWLKVRQLLIEEEQKASTHRRPHTRNTDRSEDTSKPSKGPCNTVKLLDSLAQSTAHFSLNSRASIEAEPRNPPQTFVDRMGSKFSQFMRGNTSSSSDDESSNSTKSWRSNHSESYNESVAPEGGSSSSQWMLRAALEQVVKTCQRMELSDASMAQILSHLSMIDQIAREDMSAPVKPGGSRRLSVTQYSNESSEYEKEFRETPNPLDNIQVKVAPGVRNSFKAFTSAQDLNDTMAAFGNLLADCGLNGVKGEEPWYVYYHIRAAVYNKLGFRQKQLFKLLDARFSMDVYKRRPAAGKRVCIVGAGPVGLRAAVELAILGSHVTLLEKRKRFSRENMLHLWPWVVQDLASLGAKVLLRHFCRSKTYFHVSTRQLQVILLKVALLVGVQIHTSTDFEEILPPQPEEGGNQFYTIKSSPQIPMKECTAILGATGVNDQLAEPAGINRFVFCKTESLGIVCYFPNLETPDEMKVKEFSWTAQLKHQMLNKLRDVGIDLENIVYFRGEMHYMVMTPKRHNLLIRGVVKRNYTDSKDLVRKENINQIAFHGFVNAIIRFAGVPRKADFERVSIFDFSSLTRAEKAASILTSQGKKLYVGLIGDSLMEPVWHEGVGTCRGFLGALDAVWMLSQIGKKDDKQLLTDRQLAFEVMQRLSGHHRDEMQKNVRKYTVDPASRYMVDFRQVV